MNIMFLLVSIVDGERAEAVGAVFSLFRKYPKVPPPPHQVGGKCVLQQYQNLK